MKVPSRSSYIHAMQWLGLVLTVLACIAARFYGVDFAEDDIRALILVAGPILMLVCWNDVVRRRAKNVNELQGTRKERVPEPEEELSELSSERVGEEEQAASGAPTTRGAESRWEEAA